MIYGIGGYSWMRCRWLDRSHDLDKAGQSRAAAIGVRHSVVRLSLYDKLCDTRKLFAPHSPD